MVMSSQIADAAGQSLEEPHMRHGVASSIWPRRSRRTCSSVPHAAFVADDAFVLHPLVLAAQDSQSVTDQKSWRRTDHRASGLTSVINRLRLGHLAMRPGSDFSGLAKLIRMESKSAIDWHDHMDLSDTRADLLPRRTGAQNLPIQGEFVRRLIPVPLSPALEFLSFHQLDVQGTEMQFANQHVERFGNAWFDSRFALTMAFVNLGSP